MELAYNLVGMFFVFSFGCLMAAGAFHKVCEGIQTIEHNKYSTWAKGVCSGIDRWCDYEFPQVGFTVREISNSISNGWSFDQSQFREKLRRGDWNLKESPDA